MKRYSPFLNVLGLKPHHQMQFSIISRALFQGILLLWRDEVGVFYRHNRLDCLFTLKLRDIKSQTLGVFSFSPILNGPIIVWSKILVHIITRMPFCYLILVTGTSELDEINSLVHPCFIKYHSRFVRENCFRKVNFHICLGPILTLKKLSFFDRRLCKRFFFYRFQFTKYSTPFIILDFFNSSFFKDLSAE